MKIVFGFFLLFNFVFAHKINLFTTINNSTVEIYSYFPNAKPCKNCKLIIKNKDKIVLEDRLNLEGKYNFLSKYNEIEVIIDASSGHIVKEKIQFDIKKNQNLQTHIKEEKKNEYLNILLSLIFIFIFFYIFKRIKKR